MFRRLCVFSVLLVFLSTIAASHQPRVVFDVTSSEEHPIEITEPEISRAFYGELKGAPDFYSIDSDEPFSLYVNILLPDREGFDKRDLYVEVTDSEGRRIIYLDGSNHLWEPFFEEFGRDDYLRGPEARLDVEAGVYLIKVYSGDNLGLYSLAVGERESFPPGEIINTLFALPPIKQRFFGKPFYEAFFNVFGVGLLLFILLLAALVYAAYRTVKKR